MPGTDKSPASAAPAAMRANLPLYADSLMTFSPCLCHTKRLDGHPPVRRERAPGLTSVLLDPEGFAMLPRALTCHPTIKVTGADKTFARNSYAGAASGA